MSARTVARVALITAAATLLVWELLDQAKSDGYLFVVVYGLFVVGPLLLLATSVSRVDAWAVGQAVLFISLSIAAIVLAYAERQSSSTAGVLIPIMAALQYLLLIALAAVRGVRQLTRGRPRHKSTTS